MGKENDMTTTGVPLSTDPDVDVVAWQFLADASRVSFATMAQKKSAKPGSIVCPILLRRSGPRFVGATIRLLP